MRIVEFRTELGSRRVSGLLAGCERRPFVVRTQHLFFQGLRLPKMTAHCIGLLSEPSPLALTTVIKTS
jgi:hypothetical protein